MRGLLREDKGVSEMVGYVLLVVIAVSLGGLVFTFLKIYVPSSNPVCPDDVALSIEELSCEGGVVQVKLKNRGLFNLDGAYIRIGDKDRIYKDLLNGDNTRFSDYYDEKGLPPGSLWPKNGNAVYSYVKSGLKALEIEPVMFVDNEIVLCDNAIIEQFVYCTGGDQSLGIDINKPGIGQQYNYEDNVDVELFVWGNGINECGFNVTDSLGGLVYNADLECDSYGTYNDLINGLLLTSGDYDITAFVSNGSDRTMNFGSFSVLETPGDDSIIITISSPLFGDGPFASGAYGFLDQTLNLPVIYSVFNAGTCTGRVYDSLYTQIGNNINGCNKNLNPGNWGFEENGQYNLNVSGSNSSSGLFNSSSVYFDVLVYPEIISTLSSPETCDRRISLDFTERKYPIDSYPAICWIDIYFGGVKQNSEPIEIVNCLDGDIDLIGLDWGNYRIESFVNDSQLNQDMDYKEFFTTSACQDGDACGGQCGGIT